MYEKLCKLTVGALPAGATVAALLLAAPVSRADTIPYPMPGMWNPVSYTFTAAKTGDITAYFLGSGASFDEQLGMLVNGVMSPNGFGLDDHTSTLGESFDLGSVKTGDILTFVVKVVSPSLGLIYSDPTMNGTYDQDGSNGHNHIYSTFYTATSPKIPGVPAGIYVGFEDLPFPKSDFNYTDETFVFADPATSGDPAPDSGTTVMLLGLGLIAIALAWRLHSRLAPTG